MDSLKNLKYKSKQTGFIKTLRQRGNENISWASARNDKIKHGLPIPLLNYKKHGDFGKRMNQGFLIEAIMESKMKTFIADKLRAWDKTKITISNSEQ